MRVAYAISEISTHYEMSSSNRRNWGFSKNYTVSMVLLCDNESKISIVFLVWVMLSRILVMIVFIWA